MDELDEGLERERELFSLMKTRRGKLGVLTRKRNEIHSLIDAGQSKLVISEHMKNFNNYLAEFMELQVSVQSLLNEDERETDHNDWYEPKLVSFREFLDGTNAWLKEDVVDEQNVELNPVLTAVAVAEVNTVTLKPASPVGGIGPPDSVLRAAQKPASETSSDALYDEACANPPSKALSKAPSKASSKRSNSSLAASVAHIQAEVELAALKAQAGALQEKHALDLEEAQLKARKETLTLKTNLAIAEAKVHVFTSMQDEHESSVGGDAGNLIVASSSASTDFIPPATGPRVTRRQKISPAPVPLSLPLDPPPPVASMVKSEGKSPRPISSHVEAGNVQSNALTEVMRKQNEITEMLVKQQRLSLLPSIDIPVFDGDPLQFRSFIKAFEQGIETKTDNKQDRLYYLEQFTAGQPRILVRSCMHMSPQTAYDEAKRQLEWNFGNRVKITSAFVDKALNWSVLKSDDASALRSYTFFLRSCFNTMDEAGYIDELENATNMRILVSKLPFRLRDKWRLIVCDIREKHNRRERFKDLLSFLEKQMRAALDPVFGESQNPKEKVTLKSAKPTFKAKSSSFATSVATVSEQASSKQNSFHNQLNYEAGDAFQLQCLFCNKKHAMDVCESFKQKSNKEKIEFIKNKGLCFGCLRKGHMSKNCLKRLTCGTCKKNHPTVLHIEPIETLKQTQTPKAEPKEESVSNALVSLDAGNHTGAGSKECALSVVPVKVKLEKGTKVVETYAFLDPGSSATFSTEALMMQLNANGQKVEILLRTMGQEKPVNSYKLSGLEVAALKDNVYLSLPDVYTQKTIPVTRENIPKEEDLRKWPYLRNVELNPIDASIGLLIGVNAPKALEPWRIVNSEGSGPYAVQTRLGWVINGPLGHVKDGDGHVAASVQVNRISIGNLEEMLIRQYNQDFEEQHCSEHAEMSVEDKQFMDIMSKSAVLKDGHYYLELPFRNCDVKMPNNKQVAQQRAQYLLKRFKRDQSFFDEYKEFMHNVSAEGHSEIIPQDHNVRVYVEEQEDLDGSSWKCIVKNRNDLAEVLALLKTHIDPALLVKKEGEEGSTSPKPEDQENKKDEENGEVKKEGDSDNEMDKPSKENKSPPSPKSESQTDGAVNDNLKQEVPAQDAAQKDCQKDVDEALDKSVGEKEEHTVKTTIKEEPMEVTKATDAGSEVTSPKQTRSLVTEAADEAKKKTAEEVQRALKNDQQAKIPLKKREMKLSEDFDSNAGSSGSSVIVANTSIAATKEPAKDLNGDQVNGDVQPVKPKESGTKCVVASTIITTTTTATTEVDRWKESQEEKMEVTQTPGKEEPISQLLEKAEDKGKEKEKEKFTSSHSLEKMDVDKPEASCIKSTGTTVGKQEKPDKPTQEGTSSVRKDNEPLFTTIRKAPSSEENSASSKSDAKSSEVVDNHGLAPKQTNIPNSSKDKSDCLKEPGTPSGQSDGKALDAEICKEKQPPGHTDKTAVLKRTEKVTSLPPKEEEKSCSSTEEDKSKTEKVSVTKIVDLFWKRWVREYLPILQERKKWNKTRGTLPLVMLCSSWMNLLQEILGRSDASLKPWRIPKASFGASASRRKQMNWKSRSIRSAS